MTDASCRSGQPLWCKMTKRPDGHGRHTRRHKPIPRRYEFWVLKCVLHRTGMANIVTTLECVVFAWTERRILSIGGGEKQKQKVVVIKTSQREGWWLTSTVMHTVCCYEELVIRLISPEENAPCYVVNTRCGTDWTSTVGPRGKRELAHPLGGVMPAVRYKFSKAPSHR